MAKVKVLFFGHLSAIVNNKELEFALSKNSGSVEAVKQMVLKQFPEVKKHKFRIALNSELIAEDAGVKNGDEIAFLPPISGGNFLYLTSKKITKSFINQILDTSTSSCGSVLTFRGIVRADETKNKSYVTAINYSAYETMAEKEIGKIVNESIIKFGLIDVIVKHRIGTVLLNETAFFVAVFSSHRKEGIKAIDFIIDQVKKNVPIWKEELFSDGTKSFKSGKLIK